MRRCARPDEHLYMTNSTRLTRFAAFCATVLAVGVAALTFPAIVRAEPDDFFNYLDCLKSGTPRDICCLRNGGLLNPETEECVPPRPPPILNNPGQSPRPPLPPVVGTDRTPVLTP
jgi:hypothetical protein